MSVLPVAIYVCVHIPSVRGQNNILYFKNKIEVTDPCESLDGSRELINAISVLIHLGIS